MGVLLEREIEWDLQQEIATNGWNPILVLNNSRGRQTIHLLEKVNPLLGGWKVIQHRLIGDSAELGRFHPQGTKKERKSISTN